MLNLTNHFHATFQLVNMTILSSMMRAVVLAVSVAIACSATVEKRE